MAKYLIKQLKGRFTSSHDSKITINCGKENMRAIALQHMEIRKQRENREGRGQEWDGACPLSVVLEIEGRDFYVCTLPTELLSAAPLELSPLRSLSMSVLSSDVSTLDMHIAAQLRTFLHTELTIYKLFRLHGVKGKYRKKHNPRKYSSLFRKLYMKKCIKSHAFLLLSISSIYIFFRPKSPTRITLPLEANYAFLLSLPIFNSLDMF